MTIIPDTLAEVSAESLAHAQERKLHLICRKAGLKPDFNDNYQSLHKAASASTPEYGPR
jgi:hypothetical protein